MCAPLLSSFNHISATEATPIGLSFCHEQHRLELPQELDPEQPRARGARAILAVRLSLVLTANVLCLGLNELIYYRSTQEHKELGEISVTWPAFSPT